MQVQCKCHGVSGSCEMRTCWRSLPKFRELGEHLQDRFQNALLVDYVDQRLVSKEALDEALEERRPRDTFYSSRPLYDHLVKQRLRNLPTPTENDLIFLANSPSFCHHDPQFGSIGTHGRRCDEESKGYNSCSYLCCDRGFKRETIVQKERCNCKFHWCCKVTCQTCTNTVSVSTCN